MERRRERPLSLLMIKTLRDAFKKQCNNEPIGQTDLKGSFTSLVNRGFIDVRNSIQGAKQKLWYVTNTK